MQIHVWTVTTYGEDGVDFPFPEAFHTKEEAISAAKEYMAGYYDPPTTWTVNDNFDDAVTVLIDEYVDCHIYITRFIVTITRFTVTIPVIEATS